MKVIADANIPCVAECFGSIGEVRTVPGRQITRELLMDAEVLLVRSITAVDEKLLAGTAVRFVGTATIGFEHVDVQYLAGHNIGFSSAPGSNANSVAEYVVAALLWVAEKHNIQLDGKSIGIVGVGNVGSKVEQKCRVLGMRPYLNDPPLQRQTGQAKYRPLEELFDCDFITLHTPLTFTGIDRTYHLADRHFFTSLKDGCGFINTARGAVADTEALKAAIESNRLGPVVLDVWENEPDIDVELLRMVDVATPHIAGYSLDGKIRGMIMIYKAACEFFGVEPRFDVDDFLPAAQTPEVRLNPQHGSEQEMLRETVRQAYDIERDDSNMRGLLAVPVGERPKLFDDLRKNYPVRREFYNTTVRVGDTSGAIARKLSGIGFKVVQE